jgi:hypothetical protein
LRFGSREGLKTWSIKGLEIIIKIKNKKNSKKDDFLILN